MKCQDQKHAQLGAPEVKLVTHIRVSANLLNHILVEVTGVTRKRITNAEGMLKTKVVGFSEAKERPFLQLSALILRSVDVLHPALMNRSGVGINMLLENDDV